MGYIYKITCVPTGKLYVGQTKLTPDLRLLKHFKESKTSLKHNYTPNGSYKGGCTALYKEMNKYTRNDFRVETVLECKSELLNQHEIKAIEELNSLYPNGYNLTPGGNAPHTQRTKNLIGVRTSEGITNNNINNFQKKSRSYGNA